MQYLLGIRDILVRIRILPPDLDPTPDPTPFFSDFFPHIFFLEIIPTFTLSSVFKIKFFAKILC